MKPVLSALEKDFLESLPFSQQCTEEEEELLHFVYENKLKKVWDFYLFFIPNNIFLLTHFVHVQQHIISEPQSCNT